MFNVFKTDISLSLLKPKKKIQIIMNQIEVFIYLQNNVQMYRAYRIGVLSEIILIFHELVQHVILKFSFCSKSLWPWRTFHPLFCRHWTEWIGGSWDCFRHLTKHSLIDKLLSLNPQSHFPPFIGKFLSRVSNEQFSQFASDFLGSDQMLKYSDFLLARHKIVDLVS